MNFIRKSHFLLVFSLGLGLALTLVHARENPPDWLNFEAPDSFLATPPAPIEKYEVAPRNISAPENEFEIEQDVEKIQSDLKSWGGSVHALKEDIRVQFKAKHYQEVLDRAHILLEIESRNREVLYKKAYSLKKLGRAEASLHTYNQVVKVSPRFRDAWYDRGGVLVGLKQYDKALQSFDRAVELNGKLTWLQYDRAVLLRKMQKWKEALQGFKKAVEISPRNSWALLELGNMYFSISQYVHAMKYYQKALEINSGLPGVEKNLAFCIQYLEGS
jgi:tetratricopeptide (TPR) repeat protein